MIVADAADIVVAVTEAEVIVELNDVCAAFSHFCDVLCNGILILRVGKTEGVIKDSTEKSDQTAKRRKCFSVFVVERTAVSHSRKPCSDFFNSVIPKERDIFLQKCKRCSAGRRVCQVTRHNEEHAAGTDAPDHIEKLCTVRIGITRCIHKRHGNFIICFHGELLLSLSKSDF